MNGYKGSVVKRKATFETPGTSKVSKGAPNTSPGVSRAAKNGETEPLGSTT